MDDYEPEEGYEPEWDYQRLLGRPDGGYLDSYEETGHLELPGGLSQQAQDWVWVVALEYLSDLIRHGLLDEDNFRQANSLLALWLSDRLADDPPKLSHP